MAERLQQLGADTRVAGNQNCQRFADFDARVLPEGVDRRDLGEMGPLTDVSIWIGFDNREAAAFGVARYSVKRRLTQPIPVRGVHLADLRSSGYFTRPTEQREVNGAAVTWDLISDAPVSTEH